MGTALVSRSPLYPLVTLAPACSLTPSSKQGLLGKSTFLPSQMLSPVGGFTVGKSMTVSVTVTVSVTGTATAGLSSLSTARAMVAIRRPMVAAERKPITPFMLPMVVVLGSSGGGHMVRVENDLTD